MGTHFPSLELPPALPAVTWGSWGHTDRVTQSTNSPPFLLHLLQPRLDNNPAQRGRAGQRAGWQRILLSSGGAGKISPFTSDKLFGDSSPAGESPPVQIPGEITAGDGAADRPVLYYNTNHNSCFTTPLVGFKEGRAGPAPVRARRGHSAQAAGASQLPCPAPGTSAGFRQAEGAGPSWMDMVSR